MFSQQSVFNRRKFCVPAKLFVETSRLLLWLLHCYVPLTETGVATRNRIAAFWTTKNILVFLFPDWQWTILGRLKPDCTWLLLNRCSAWAWGTELWRQNKKELHFYEAVIKTRMTTVEKAWAILFRLGIAKISYHFVVTWVILLYTSLLLIDRSYCTSIVTRVILLY